MKHLNLKERIDHRYLGALRIVDRVTGGNVARPLILTAPGLTFFSNRSSLQVIAQADGLAAHISAFETPPDEPDAGTLDFDVIVTDPIGEYLHRTFSLHLPRVPEPEHADSLFSPVDITVFPAPIARPSPNWSIIRASVHVLVEEEEEPAEDAVPETPLPGALLRVLDAENHLLMSGLSDPRGEAVIMIPGIPITRFADGEPTPPDDEEDEDDEGLATGPVLETQTPATLEVIVSPDTPWPVDPDQMESNHATWRKQFRHEDGEDLLDSLDIALKTGKTQAIKLYVSLTDNS